MKTMYLAAAMASALTLSTPASAGFFDLTLAPYVGASAGKSDADISCPAATSCDNKDTAWKVYGGMEVNEYLSMEVGYANLGTTTYSSAGVGGRTGTRETHGMTVQLVGTYALNPNFTLIGKGGFGIINTEVNGTIAGTPNNNAGDTDLEWSVGMGAQYNFTKTVGLRAEWERYFNVGDSDSTRESTIDMITAGVVFKF